MTSQIDPTLPITGTPTTASVRGNFQISHDEITALQNAVTSVTAAQVAITPAIGTLGPNVQAGLGWLNSNMAPLQSPPLVGNPTAPTPAPGNNSASLATTAWVVGYGATLAYLPTGGGTMTGIAHFVPGNTIDGAAGTDRTLIGRTGTLPRWALDLGNSNAESTGNVGSDFSILRYTDAGAIIDAPFRISRQYGTVNILTSVGAGTPFYITGPSASYRGIAGMTNGVIRWGLYLGNNTADPAAGSNAGSDFQIVRYNDAGAFLDSPLICLRNSGRMQFTGLGPSEWGAAGIVCGHAGAVGIVNGVAGFCFDPASNAVFESSGNPCAYFNRISSSGTSVLFMQGQVACGSITTAVTTTAYNTTSDDRLKEDAQPADAGPIIDATNVYNFAWKDSGIRAYGVIAQEAVKVFPDAVTYDEPNDWWGVDNSKYVPLLLAEVKALRGRVAALEGK